MKYIVKGAVVASAISSTLFLGGCAAIGTEVAHHSLQAQTEMSNSIFLTPVAGHNRSIYVQSENTTGNPDFTITSQLISKLRAKGYTVYSNPSNLKKAYYLLQTNLLRVGRYSQTAAQEMMGGGYGGTLTGAAVGAATGVVATNSLGGAVAGGILGGIGSTIANNLVKDVTYSGIVDVRITIQKTHKRFETRIATSANQAGLKFKDAAPKLEAELADSISGLFA